MKKAIAIRKYITIVNNLIQYSTVGSLKFRRSGMTERARVYDYIMLRKETLRKKLKIQSISLDKRVITKRWVQYEAPLCGHINAFK